MIRISDIRLELALLAAATSLCGCAGKAQSTTDNAAAGNGSAGSVAVADAGPSPARVPASHRASGASCPRIRAAIHPTPTDTMCDSDSSVCQELFPCTQDSDCSEGSNGRCGQSAAPFRDLVCSYDTCFSDSDCADDTPCECRTGPTDSTNNACVTASDCQVDSDCGAGGYCSPSLVNDFCFCPSPALCGPGDSCSPGPCSCGDSCGHGYFCHTPADTCVDDSDCGSNGTCNFDSLAKHWTCAECWSVP
jgi:hypothetical protein